MHLRELWCSCIRCWTSNIIILLFYDTCLMNSRPLIFCLFVVYCLLVCYFFVVYLLFVCCLFVCSFRCQGSGWTTASS